MTDEKPREGQLLLGDERRADGQHIPAGGPGTLEDPHAHESNATELIGTDWKLEDLDAEWVVKRLMRESTDYGKRSRQTARVAALGMLARATGILADESNPLRQPEDQVQKALALSPEDRRRLITQRVQELVNRGEIDPADLKKRG